MSDGTICKCLPLLDEDCKVKYEELIAKSHFGTSRNDIFLNSEEFDYKNNEICSACRIKNNCKLCYITTSSIEKTNDQVSVCGLFMNRIEKGIQGFFNNDFGVKISDHIIISNDVKRIDCLHNNYSIDGFELSTDETKFILELIRKGECFYSDIVSNNNIEEVFRNLLYNEVIVKFRKDDTNYERIQSICK